MNTITKRGISHALSSLKTQLRRGYLAFVLLIIALFHLTLIHAASYDYEQISNTAHQALETRGYSLAPTLNPGFTTNINLVANQTNSFYFNAAKDVYYGVTISNIFADIQLDLAPAFDPASHQTFTNGLGWTCPSSDTYRLDISSCTNTAASVRLYTLTNTIARLSELITNLMIEQDLVGCGISLVDGSQTVWQAGFGLADRERGITANEETVFMIGSCSKTFGALAAMQLAEEGLIDLDAPVVNALPSFAIHQRFENSIITPRTILTHHSGLPGDIFNQCFTVRPLPGVPDALQTMLTNEYTLMPTNTFWAYNNSGFIILGQMFRHITGQSIDVFARERLFDRIGMTNSSIAYDLPHIKKNLSRPYVGKETGPDEYINIFFAGAIYSTAADMASYMKMLIAGGMGENARVLSNETFNAMTVKQNKDIFLDQYNTLLNMGIGFMLDPPSLQYMGKVIWHDGATVYFRTLLRVATDAKLGCFISCNTAEGDSMNNTVVNSALKWAFEEKTGIVPPASIVPEEYPANIPPPKLIAMATNGVFVTGSGYDHFSWDGKYLLAHFNAHSDASSELPMIYRENGWFTPTNSFTPQIAFTQYVERVINLYKNFTGGVTNITLLGERSTNITGFDPVWSNRLGRWWTTDMHPYDISWLGEEVRITYPMLNLFERDNMLLVQAENLYVMSATNDTLAFAAGLGRNKGSALRVIDNDLTTFMGVIYRSESSIPTITPNASTNGLTLGDEIYWFRISETASPLIINLVTEHDITAYIYTENNEYLGQANRDQSFRLDVSNAQPLMIAIVRYGTNIGAWTLNLIKKSTPRDFGGEGISGMVVYHEPTGNWYIWSLVSGLITWETALGGPGYIPVPGDYNGDGQTDFAV